MGFTEGEGTPVHELRGFAAWKAQISNILIKIDTDGLATKHKTGQRVKSLQVLGEKVSRWTRNKRAGHVDGTKF